MKLARSMVNGDRDVRGEERVEIEQE